MSRGSKLKDIFTTPEWKEQVCDEKKTQPNIVGCRTEFLDMVDGDYPTAMILNDIYFWHLPPKEDTENKGTKLGICREGTYWLARKNTEWEHLRLNRKQVMKCMNTLKNKGWIETKITCINASKEKHTLIKITRKFLQDLRRFKAENIKVQNETLIENKVPKRTLIENKVPKRTLIENKVPKRTLMGVSKSQNGLSWGIKVPKRTLLYTDSFVSDSFEEQILGNCVPESIELRKEIGEKAKQVLLSWEQLHNPVALLKGYENLWAEYLGFVQEESTLVVGTEVGRLITYCRILGVVPTPETCKRLEAIWNRFECGSITHPYEDSEWSILLILLFVLRQKAPGWLPSDIEPENLDSVLWALLAYYEKHHEELEFPA